jgi:LemA protein
MIAAFFGFVFVLVLAVSLYAVMIYNRLVRLRNTVKSAWSDVDVQLKKRYDLVPNLVETVKGYAQHEKSLFEKVTEARATAIHATRPADKSKAENLFQESIRTLFAVAEAYPELKASENFRQLQMQLKELEDGIENSRRYYNAVVRDFNILIESFPSSVVASQFKFAQEEFFELEAPEVERKPVKVSFS